MSKPSLTAPEKIESLLYQYVNLYERWSEDRQVFAKQGAELLSLIKAMQLEVKQLESIEKTVRHSLSQQLNSVIEKVSSSIISTASMQAKNMLEDATHRLRHVVNCTESALQQSIWSTMKSSWQWFGASILVGALSSLIFVCWLFPTHVYTLTDHQISLMHTGSGFVDILSDASPAQRKHLLSELSKLEKKGGKGP